MHPFTQFAFSAFTLTLFSRLLHHPRHQIRPSSEREERRKRNTRIFIWIYTSNNLTKLRQKKKTKTEKKEREAQTFHRSNRQKRGTKLNHTHTHTRVRLPDTQLTLTDKHTKKQQTQSPAQPEVYFMQKYSKVCFTIQLNIKGWYIPLWSLTPQWTNPTHPHPLTAYRESCWTSPLITR